MMNKTPQQTNAITCHLGEHTGTGWLFLLVGVSLDRAYRMPLSYF